MPLTIEQLEALDKALKERTDTQEAGERTEELRPITYGRQQPIRTVRHSTRGQWQIQATAAMAVPRRVR